MTNSASPSERWLIGTNFAVAGGTLVVAIVAAWVAIRDGRQRDAELRDRQAAQARLVAVSVITVDDQCAEYLRLHPGEKAPPSLSRLYNDYWSIVNHSSGPVFDLEILGGEQGAVPYRAPLAPGKSAGRLPSFVQEREGLNVTFRFVDEVGLRWQRKNNGQPQRLIGD
ncbi:hypothetical protein [Streptomyces sp. NPDC049915]|uniref:hypothetical protein n=1 Tax=Streptomyces sp. NPDC049915 TaxID=3155510 RepID=UPI0034157281